MATHQKKHQKNVKYKNKNNELIIKSDDTEEYAKVTGSKGDFRFEVEVLPEGKLLIAKIKGALIKGPGKQRIEKGNLVLIQKDSTFTYDDKYYIIHKYNENDEEKLKKSGELNQECNNNITFDNDSDEELDISKI